MNISTGHKVIFEVSRQKDGLFKRDCEYPLRQFWVILAKYNFEN